MNGTQHISLKISVDMNLLRGMRGMFQLRQLKIFYWASGDALMKESGR